MFIEAGIYYMLPKVGSYLSTYPADKIYHKEELTSLERIQKVFGEFKGKVIAYTSPTDWEILNVIVFENLYISSLLTAVLFSFCPLHIEYSRSMQFFNFGTMLTLTAVVFFSKSLFAYACHRSGYSKIAETISPKFFPKQEQIEEDEPFDYENFDFSRLKEYSFIPKPFWGKSPFYKYICPLTKKPIRFILKDPKDGTNYERDALLKRLKVACISPVSRHFLRVSDLKEGNNTNQSEIDYQLFSFSLELPNFTEENLQWARNYLSNIGNISFPPFFYEKPTVIFDICPITKLQINECAGPQVDDPYDKVNCIKYEKSAALEIIRKGEKPPNWPDHIPATEENLVDKSTSSISKYHYTIAALWLTTKQIPAQMLPDLPVEEGDLEAPEAPRAV